MFPIIRKIQIVGKSVYVNVPTSFLEMEQFKGSHLYVTFSKIKDRECIICFLNMKRNRYKRKIITLGGTSYINIPLPIITELEKEFTISNDDSVWISNMEIDDERAFVYFLEEEEEGEEDTDG